MNVDVRSTIVRILAADGSTTVGAGFMLTGDGLLVTCAHVVVEAGGGSGSTVRVVFHLTGDESHATVEPGGWRDPKAEDVAILRLNGALPEGVLSFPIARAEHNRGDAFVSFGYSKVGQVEETHVRGTIYGLVNHPRGWHLLQLTSQEVSLGVSGAPVFNTHTERVVGMISEFPVWKDKDGRAIAGDAYGRHPVTNHAIPTEVLLKVWPDLERVLQAPTVPVGKLLIPVPKRPLHFLPRSNDLKQINDAILAKTNKPVLVYGMGGSGKSVLAAELARNAEVRRDFPDGVLWVKIGQAPKLTLRQSDMCRVLGDPLQTFEDVQQGKTRLGTLLENRACLVILDNVWDKRHAEAFDALGSGCRMLVTTRDAGLTSALEAKEHRLDVLSDEDALKLLAQWAELDVETLPPESNEVAEECGNLPLALALSAAQVRDGSPWGDLLDALREADLEFLDHPHGSVMKSLQASIDALPVDQARRYLELAVFPNDEIVPEAAVLTLWLHASNLKARHARKLLTMLERKSLLRLEGQAPKRRFSLHNLQYDYVCQQTDDLPALHQRLLQAYATQCPTGWPSGPDDGYYFQHLANHLVQAGRVAELRELLLDFDWLQAKLDATDVNSLLADYELLPDDGVARLVQGAIRLSAHVLTRDKTQLPGQLLGRLLSFESTEIQTMLEQAKRWKAAPWLRSLAPSLSPPGGPLLRTLTGHTHWVNAVAVTPDGQWAVSASDDRTLKVWDLERGKELHTLMGHTRAVIVVAVTLDKRRAVSSSYKTIKVWDLERGEELRTLTGHTRGINAVAVTPDGRRVISASEDRTLKVWDLERGEELRTLTGHSRGVMAVAVTSDGQRVVSASGDKMLKVWDLERGEELRTLTGHRRGIMAMAMTPDGRQAVSAADFTLKVWDLERGEELRTLTGHTNLVMAVAVTPDGRQAVSASINGALKVWDLKRGEELRTLTGHTDWVMAVAVTPDGRRAVSVSRDRTLKMWDLERGEEPNTLTGHSRRVIAVAVAPDCEASPESSAGGGRRAVSASIGKTFKVWDLERGEELRTLTGHSRGVMAVVVVPDGWRAISAPYSTLEVWDLELGEKLRTLTGHTDRVEAVAVTPDGRRAVSASINGTLKVWNLEQGAELCTLTGHKRVKVVAMTPNGRRAVSASDKTLKVWNLRDQGEELRTLTGNMGKVNAVAVTPDGRQAVSASINGALKVWDLERGEELRTLTGHTSWVEAVAVTPDGQWAVSTSNDRTLKVWDIGESGKLVATFSGDSALTACAVAPDGTIVVGEESGRVHFLRLEGA